MERAIRGLLAKYPKSIAVTWRHFPLSYHEGAVPAARAAQCAQRLGGFSKFHEMLLGDPRWRWNPRDAFVEMATDAGIQDSAAFASCLGDLSSTPEIRRDEELARRLQLSATPSFILDGVLLPGRVDSVALDSIVAASIGVIER